MGWGGGGARTQCTRGGRTDVFDVVVIAHVYGLCGGPRSRRLHLQLPLTQHEARELKHESKGARLQLTAYHEDGRDKVVVIELVVLRQAFEAGFGERHYTAALAQKHVIGDSRRQS